MVIVGKKQPYRVVTYPDPVLAKRAEDVTKVSAEVKKLIKDMFEIMYQDRGVGLAAPQIGVSKRIFIANPEGVPGGPELAFINPVLSGPEGEVWGPEGCLSLPGISADVPRASKITVKALDGEGQPVDMTAEDFLARIIQHENDHLDGKLFIDRVGFMERQQLLTLYKQNRQQPTSTPESENENRFFRFL